MDDRVRIYELARKMNLPNQDIITGLRELGYDIKTHSSTVDSNAIGLLIAALGKKKQQGKAKPAKEASKTVAKVVTPPQPPVVKPRVLSRYRPLAAPLEGSAAEITDSSLSHASPTISSSHPIGAPHSTASASAPPVESNRAIAPSALPASSLISGSAPQAHSPATTGESTAVAARSKSLTSDEVTDPHRSALSSKSKSEKTVSSLDQATAAKSSGLGKEPGSIISREHDEIASQIEIEPFHIDGEHAAQAATDKIGERLDLLDNLNFAPPGIGQVVKPIAPSVPIRIAAPSIRATPPRPPKSHRQAPSERHTQPRKEEKAASPAAATIEVPKVINLTSTLTVQELADKMGVSESEVIKRLFMKGTMRTVNQLVELDLAKELAQEMEYEVSTETISIDLPEQDQEAVLSDEDRAALVQRPPVVTIMGHVDHGKTSLLDAIRQTKFLLTDAEAGGITQHIGAYHVEVPHEDGTLRQIVFLDTPGHEAFTAMRARGARATDIAILVVAADDGIMPQTIEAIDHAKAAGVPIIVAVNKIDKPGADPNRILGQMMEHGLVPEALGGETVCVNVSAKKRTNLDQLLEMILLVAELQDLKANPDRPAEGVIIEAELSRGRGAVATALVENGTLREGDFIVAGSKSGRVRALFDDRGQRVKAAGPSMPVEVLGLDEVPLAGERFEVVEDGQAVKLLVESRKTAAGDRKQYHVTLESLHDMLSSGEMKELNIIIKADVQGTAEAIADSIKRLSGGGEVQVRVLRTASGDISENDVNLAASSNAIIIGFNVQPDQNASKMSEASGVDIRTYNVIYQITDDLQKAIQGLIQPIRTEVPIGSAEVRQVFKFGKNLMIAGCMVTSGKITRGALARIMRNGELVYEGKIETLKRFKDEAKEVAQGFECGISLEKFSTVQEGDIINAFIIQETKRDISRS